jgi:hypothetical protein
MQLSYYGGSYSIHRALAFDEYCKKAPKTRVLAVCLATPLPMVFLVYGQELVPLQALEEGWAANYGMWIRAAVLVGIVTHALLIQATYLIDDFSVTLHQRLVLYLVLPALVVSISMLVSANVVFPIPFYVLFVPPPFYVMLVVMIRLVVGARAFQEMLKDRVQVDRCVRFVCAQTSTVFISPVYEMLFTAAQGTPFHLPVILLLPVIKVALKNLVLHFAKALEDMAPVEVIFTADFFNAIYVATSMQSSTSATSIIAITITDLSQTAFMLYGLQRRTATILSRLQRLRGSSADGEDVLSMVCFMCRNPDALRRHSHALIRRRSCLRLQIAVEDDRLLDSLDQIFQATIIDNEQGPTTDATSALCCLRRKLRQATIVQPAPVIATSHKMTRASSKRPNILLESLQTLFTMECLVTTAYLEAFMPLFYSSFMLLMVHLPNVQYHIEMTGVTRETVVSTVLPLFVFGLLQIVSFVLLAVVIRRNCRMQALYHLAFVLEMQRSLVICKMMLWMVITLCFRVTHFGTFPTFAVGCLTSAS